MPWRLLPHWRQICNRSSVTADRANIQVRRQSRQRSSATGATSRAGLAMVGCTGGGIVLGSHLGANRRRFVARPSQFRPPIRCWRYCFRSPAYLHLCRSRPERVVFEIADRLPALARRNAGAHL
jgi:hypothetical protein